ncbi:MAG TPA: TolC family protein [Bacteroidales bacterium]|nr:TolC family protein [Bacteroidales bacterium]
MAKWGKLKWLFTFMLLSSLCSIKAQKVLTLKECYESALATSALAGEKRAYSDISALREKNIAAGWYPSLDVNASALYNSDVVDLSSKFAALPIPGLSNAIGSMPHDQYKVTLDINQVIYDGGSVKSARELEKAELKVNEKQTETDLYKVRSMVNGYYFNILLLRRQKELYSLYLDLIEKRLKSVQSAVENGVMLRSDADVLRSEMINLQQQLSENEIKSNSLIGALSDLIGMPIESSTELVLPLQNREFSNEIMRPEVDLLESRKEQLSAGESLSASKRMPKAFGFATLGYGNPPGSNFFADEFDTYYIIGAGIKWNIFDWNRVKNEKQVISVQKSIIDNRKKDLTDNIRRQLEIKSAEISNLEKLIESDSELAEIRKRITASADSQHTNGTITATEYLNILNAEKQVMINSEIHRINLSLARIEYLNISGQDPE